MKARNYYAFWRVGLVFFALAMVFPTKKRLHKATKASCRIKLYASGLAPGAVFPFIDTTPRRSPRLILPLPMPHELLSRRCSTLNVKVWWASRGVLVMAI